MLSLNQQLALIQLQKLLPVRQSVKSVRCVLRVLKKKHILLKNWYAMVKGTQKEAKANGQAATP